VRAAGTLRVALTAALVAVTAGALALPPGGPAAQERRRGVRDNVWRHPDSAAFAIRGIAMLPAASYDRDLQAEKLADQLWGATLRGTGHRWVSSTSTRALVAAGPGGDSLLRAAAEQALAQGRADSLLAPELCRRTRTGAVMTLRVDRWEQLKMEFNQAGKPSTTVSLTAALVDSTGRLLWRISGSETAEGPYHDPRADVVGVKTTGLGTQPITGQGGPPSHLEVLNALYARWKEHVPVPVVPGAR